jgi:lipopolysaccharide exporter
VSTVRRAIAFSFVESYLGIVLSLLSFVLLARLLTPAQVGLFSVAMALISITQVIRDFGLVSFLIQKKDLDTEHIASAWALALAFGATLFVLVQLGAPAIGSFYNDASLTSIARIIGLNFLVLPFNSVCLALLRRSMNFKAVMRINLSAAFCSTMLTLLLAWTGFGAFALALGAVANNAFVAVGILATGAAARLPRPALLHWREILGFGGPLTAANVITSVAMDINDLAVGKILGFQSVAIISRAQGLMNLFHRDFMTAVRNVAYPAFSQANRDGGAMEEKFIASVGNVTAVAFTFYGFAALFPLETLRLMFGPQWDQSAPLVPLFCLAGAASSLVSLVPTIMLATGHSKLVATLELIFQPTRAITLCAATYYFRDLHAFALGFLLVASVSVPYFYSFKQRCLPTRFGQLGRALAVNLLLAAAALSPAMAIAWTWRPFGQALPTPLFLACAGCTMLAWPAALMLGRHPLSDEVRAMLKARRAAPAGTGSPP